MHYYRWHRCDWVAYNARAAAALTTDAFYRIRHPKDVDRAVMRAFSVAASKLLRGCRRKVRAGWTPALDAQLKASAQLWVDGRYAEAAAADRLFRRATVDIKVHVSSKRKMLAGTTQRLGS